MARKPLIVLLAGPTASGKSKLAIKLSKVLNGEIINADSMQVYKELNILTSRPPTVDLKKIKHQHVGNFKGSYAPMKDSTKDFLIDFYKKHNQKLFELIGKKFNWDE